MFNFICGFVFCVAVLMLCGKWANQPIVQVSYKSNECVKVISNDSSHSCENLPRKYVHEWVK